MFRRLFVSALVPVVAMSVLAGAGEASAAPAWSPCQEGKPGECATVQVPVDWNNPSGEKVGVAIGRLKATEPEHRIGVLFVAPGGPGGSGIDLFVLGDNKLTTGELRKRFDIVTWDQRGVGRSNEVRCSAEILSRRPGDYPANEQQYRNLVAYNAELGADCRKHTGPLFDHLDTTNVVRDLDAVRGALGEEKISLFGSSYGSQVAQQYAESFPARLRAVTIGSNLDHSITSPGHYLATATADLEASFNAFADWCARTANCPLHGQDVRARWDALHAKAEAGTLTDPDNGQALSAEGLRGELLGAMFTPSSRWYAFATRLRSLAAGTKTGAAATSGTTAAEELGANSYQAIWCEDWKWRVDGYRELRALREQAAALAPHTKLSPFWNDVATCLGWPAEVTNPQHRLSISNAPKILIMTSAADVAAPHAWNVAVSQQISNSVLLTYDGVGHGQYTLSSCARAHVDRYLTDLVTPAPGTHCAAEYPTAPPMTAQRSLI
ncbi:alpha/beta hydrolase [Lentzea sp. NPDC004782]|uniref:alpha/beta hydrolase n=1 Tax=Lentzea sp. NPDC004782 TaxID=3154458 RepID=UPI0033A326AF